MAYFRRPKDHDHPFSLIPNNVIEDDSLSWKAKGLLAFLLSKSDDWEIYQEQLAKCSTDGRHATRTAIDELVDAGYIVRSQRRDESGQFDDFEYIVYEEPVPPEERTTNAESTDMGFSDIGLSDMGSSDMGKGHTTNKDNTNTDSTKNEVDVDSGADALTGEEAWVTDSNALFVDEANRLMDRYDPENCHELIKNQWGSGTNWAWSAISSLYDDFGWRRFVLAAVITANQANHPNPSFMRSVLENFQTNERDNGGDADEDEDDSPNDLFVNQ